MTLSTDASSHTIIEHDAHIVWLLEHPGASDWLKAALRSARECDPIVLNTDLQLLSFVLGRWVEAQIKSALEALA